jgi:hypothetical protein
MEPQQVLGVTKEVLDSYLGRLLVDNQDPVLVKEDLVVVQELTRIIQAVVPVVVTQAAPHPIMERILKAVVAVPIIMERTR